MGLPSRQMMDCLTTRPSSGHGNASGSDRGLSQRRPWRALSTDPGGAQLAEGVWTTARPKAPRGAPLYQKLCSAGIGPSEGSPGRGDRPAPRDPRSGTASLPPLCPRTPAGQFLGDPGGKGLRTEKPAGCTLAGSARTPPGPATRVTLLIGCAETLFLPPGDALFLGLPLVLGSSLACER